MPITGQFSVVQHPEPEPPVPVRLVVEIGDPVIFTIREFHHGVPINVGNQRFQIQLSIQEVVRLIEFLDAGLLADCPPAVSNGPRRPVPVENARGQVQCAVCGEYYFPNDTQWRPEYGQYICNRNWRELHTHTRLTRAMTAEPLRMTRTQIRQIREEDRIP